MLVNADKSEKRIYFTKNFKSINFCFNRSIRSTYRKIGFLRRIITLLAAGVTIMNISAVSEIKAPAKNSKNIPRRVESIVDITGTPVLRVEILSDYKRVDLHFSGTYDLTDLKGKVIIPNLESKFRWRCKVERSEPAVFNYQVLLKTFVKLEDAVSLMETLQRQGVLAEVVEIGSIIRIEGNLINDSRRYRVVAGSYAEEDDCDTLMQRYFDDYNPKVIRRLVQAATGKIEYYDSEFEISGTVDNGFRLAPKSTDCKLTLHRVKVGKGFHFEETEDRVFSGIMEFRIDHEGAIQAINEAPIDVYLKGVVPAEMPASYPLEALKAQAVAARSEVLCKLGTKHMDDPFDLCANVHCQVYAGLTKTSPRTDSAVVATTGEVLYFNSEVCDAVYSSVCGGHTENKENVWNSPPEKYLEGVFDGITSEGDTFKLTDESDLHKWVDTNPEVCCNVKLLNNTSAMNGANKYFRWEETITRSELESTIKQKTGVDIGTFYGIVPLKRGVSGRLMEIELLGSRRNHRIKGELNIRRSLSNTHLRSAAFYTEITYDPDGVPYEITFKGAGWGHGVGMCQVGAAVMAAKGKDYKEILQHYYPGTVLKKAYVIIKSSGLNNPAVEAENREN